MSSPIERNYFWEVHFINSPSFYMEIINAELQQSEESHDYLIIDFKGSISTHTRESIRPDDPVKFSWGDGQFIRDFVGFVHNIENITTSGNVYTRIHCINNSAVFKESNKKIYKELTSSQIVEEIGKAHDFFTKVSYHPYVHKNLVQSGNSDWQTLGHLANYTGYALRANNTTLIFKDRDQLINESIENMPIFTHLEHVAGGFIPQQTLYSFTALDSIITPETNTGDAGVVLYGDSGEKYTFDSEENVYNGKYVSSSPSVPNSWNNTYGVN